MGCELFSKASHPHLELLYVSSVPHGFELGEDKVISLEVVDVDPGQLLEHFLDDGRTV